MRPMPLSEPAVCETPSAVAEAVPSLSAVAVSRTPLASRTCCHLCGRPCNVLELPSSSLDSHHADHEFTQYPPGP